MFFIRISFKRNFKRYTCFTTRTFTGRCISLRRLIGSRLMQWSFAAELFRTQGTVFSYETNFDSVVLQAMKAVSYRAQPTLFHPFSIAVMLADCQPRCKRTGSVYRARFFLRLVGSRRRQRFTHINFPNNDSKTVPTFVICSVISLSSRCPFRYISVHTLHQL